MVFRLLKSHQFSKDGDFDEHISKQINSRLFKTCTKEISSIESHTWFFPFQMLTHILGLHIHLVVSLVVLVKAYGIDYVAQTQKIVHLMAMKRNRLVVINQTAQVKKQYFKITQTDTLELLKYF